MAMISLRCPCGSDLCLLPDSGCSAVRGGPLQFWGPPPVPGSPLGSLTMEMSERRRGGALAVTPGSTRGQDSRLWRRGPASGGVCGLPGPVALTHLHLEFVLRGWECHTLEIQ